MSRKIITSHIRAERQKRKLSGPLGLAGRLWPSDDGGDDDDDDYLSELGSHQRPKMGFGQSFGWPVTIRLCALWI